MNNKKRYFRKNSPIVVIRTKDYLRVAEEVVSYIQETNVEHPENVQQVKIFSPALETFKGLPYSKDDIVASIQKGDAIILILPENNLFNADELQYIVSRLVFKEQNSVKLFIISPSFVIPSEIDGYVEEVFNYTIENGLNSIELRRAEDFDGGVVEFRKKKLDGKILEIFNPSKIDKAIGLEKVIHLIKEMANSKIGKGTLLLGVPGVGKTLIAKNLSTIYTVVKFNISLLYNKYVGETEQRLREAIQTLKEFGEAIVFIDEFEKMMAGGIGDNGVSQRLIGELLQWFEEDKKQYVIATANNITRLPLELLRTGRWDFILGITPPPQHIIEKIEQYYAQKYNLKFQHSIYQDEITPSDIETIYRVGKVIGLEKATQMIKLTKQTASNWKKSIELIDRYAVNVWKQIETNTKNLI
jgi:hypothetical protein